MILNKYPLTDSSIQDIINIKCVNDEVRILYYIIYTIESNVNDMSAACHIIILYHADSNVLI